MKDVVETTIRLLQEIEDHLEEDDPGPSLDGLLTNETELRAISARVSDLHLKIVP